MVAIKKKS